MIWPLRTVRSGALGALGALALAACLSCSEPEQGANGRAVDPADLPIPEPDLTQVEPALRAGLEADQERIFAKAREGSAPATEIGDAFGELGQVYQTYELRESALLCYDNAAQLLPADSRWPYLSGLIHAHLGDLEEAARAFEHTLELAPGDLAALIRLGNVHLDATRPEEALSAFEQALERDPVAAAAHFGIGRARAALGDHAAAVEHFEETLRLQPAATSVHYPLSQALRRLGRTDDARRHLELRGRQGVAFPDPHNKRLGDIKILTGFRVVQTLAAQPDEVDPPDLLGFTLTQLGRVQGSIEQLQRVIEAKESAAATPADRLELGRLHYVVGGLQVFDAQDAAGIASFRRALELAPDLDDARIKLGNAVARAGSLEEAIDQYSQALERDPANTDAAVKKATALLNLRRLPEARDVLLGVLKSDPANAVVHVRLANLLEASGAADRALERYEQALAQDMPDSGRAVVHKGLADYYRRRGDGSRAIEQLQLAADLDPIYVTARLELASLLGQANRFEEAAAEYRRVVTNRPKNVDARYGESAALLLAGRLADARDRMEEAIAVLPHESGLGLQHLLARVLAAAPEDGLRDGERALELALEVERESEGDQAAETVAMAYAEIGDFSRAAEWQRRAASPSAAATRRLGLYEENRPFRAGSPADLLVLRPGG